MRYIYNVIFLLFLVNICYSQGYMTKNPSISANVATNTAIAGDTLKSDGINNYWGLGGSSGSSGYDTNIYISSNIDVLGVTVGNYSNGMVISNNTTLRSVLLNMFQKQVIPIYTNPTLSLAYSGTLAVEAGTSNSPTLTPTFTQKDAGSLLYYLLYENSSIVHSNTSATATNIPLYQIGDNTFAYIGRAYYDQGAIKNDNFGVPYPTGRIEAGYVNSSTYTYVGYRRFWSDVASSTNTIADSAAVRALTTTTLHPVNGTTFTLTIPAGTKQVVFAYPATLQAVTSVKYVELGNAEVKDTFTESTVSVEGTNGFTGINYRVYIYRPAVPFGDAATYNGTI